MTRRSLGALLKLGRSLKEMWAPGGRRGVGRGEDVEGARGLVGDVGEAGSVLLSAHSASVAAAMAMTAGTPAASK